MGIFFTYIAFISAAFSGDYMVMYWLFCAIMFYSWRYLNDPR